MAPTSYDQADTMATVRLAWTDFLDVVPHDDDNFFQLGGHSLVAALVAHQLQEHLGVEVPLGLCLTTPVLSDLVAAVHRLRLGADAVNAS